MPPETRRRGESKAGTSPSISIIVRCLNEARHIGRLFEGIAAQTVQPDEVVVVDSGSTDGTVKIARRYGGKIHTIKPEEFSFGRSLNRGIAAATGDIIVNASAHVYPVYDTWLEHMTKPFEDPEIVLTYGRQIAGPSTAYSESQILATWFPTESNPRQTHPFSNNANAAIRRSEWEKVPYDEDLTGLEDLDWAAKALERGGAIAYVAEAPVVHLHDEAFSQTRNRYRREAIAHQRIFKDQRMGRLQAGRLMVANIATDYVHAARDGKLAANLIKIPRFRTAQFIGTYEGFSQRGDIPAELRRRFFYPRGIRRSAEDEAAIGTPIAYDAPEHDREPAPPR